MAQTTKDCSSIAGTEIDAKNLYYKHLEVCYDLNVDAKTQVYAWGIYRETANKFLLEGNPMHWLCCSLYVASQNSQIPIVGGTGDDVIVGNCIRLNHLLRSCCISIYEFIEKVKIWCNMTEMSTKIQYRVRKLERKFGLTLLMFQHYKEIFQKLYRLPNQTDEGMRKWRNGKFVKKFNCCNLYDMCWLLFLCAKNELPNLTTDLVATYHLLICCVELIYRNVLAEGRQELVNEEFAGVPAAWQSEHFDKRILSDYCAIQSICTITEAMPEEAKKMKAGMFETVINNFLTANIILSGGSTENLLNITSDGLFWLNFKSLNRSYEQFMLSVGDFDERILPDYALTQSANNIDLSYKTPGTPLTRRELLPLKPPGQLIGGTVVDKALDNVRQLQRVAGLHELSTFVRRHSNDNGTRRINELLRTMSQDFCATYSVAEEAQQRFSLAQSLYYFLLERIARAELQHKPAVCLSKLLEQTIFNMTLMACCVELVLEAYDSTSHNFPWILKCFDIEAFHFYKIIEIVVLRNDGILTRGLIKHLNAIEETCLEELVWQKQSLVWTLIRANGYPLPDYQEVNTNVAVKQKFSKKNCVRSLWSTSSIKQLPSDDLKKINTSQSTSSLAIFLRKIYKLAWLRLYKLCLDLDLNQTSLGHIWSIFEHSLTHHTTLIAERHMDQLLMCAIYIYVRVENNLQTKFVDIIKYYRIQPQAKSVVYRHVLLQPSTSSGSSSNEGNETKLEYNDLIAFYNRNYVPKMTLFVLDSKRRHGRHFSRMPDRETPSHIESHKRLTSNHYLFVSPMSKILSESKTNNTLLTYEFHKSPSKYLQEMNNAVCKTTQCYDDQCQCRKRPNILKCNKGGSKRQKTHTPE